MVPSLTLHHLFFFFNDTAPTEIYTLSLQDALPIWQADRAIVTFRRVVDADAENRVGVDQDRKSTRLNSSHVALISYAVFSLKKKIQESEPNSSPIPCRRALAARRRALR